MQVTPVKRYVNVAIYGPLKSASGYTYPPLNQTNFQGSFHTPAQFKLYQYGDIPVAIKDGQEPLPIDVYTITGEELQQFDSLLRYPTVYDRIQCNIPKFGNTWLYVMSEGYAALAGVYQHPIKTTVSTNKVIGEPA
ncbi:gamma-glutamylcyclotransferase [Celerinatantimonas yamalensis]|uniref:Gamma-glutamylcyclotransferase n=1 Tax=Celerinatantimonas yamalensis TaxID=559956 RepID=A0ABW9G359_9GAMM